MKKKLSIIIPYHLEEVDELKPLFRSLNTQVGIDFNTLEILMCKDTEEKSEIDDYEFTEYENLAGRIKKFTSPYRCNPGMSSPSNRASISSASLSRTGSPALLSAV